MGKKPKGEKVNLLWATLMVSCRFARKMKRSCAAQRARGCSSTRRVGGSRPGHSLHFLLKHQPLGSPQRGPKVPTVMLTKSRYGKYGDPWNQTGRFCYTKASAHPITVLATCPVAENASGPVFKLIAGSPINRKKRLEDGIH